jgi:hypothetical protein
MRNINGAATSAAQQAARLVQRTAIERRGNGRQSRRFPAATSHSFALDVLVSKGKIVQSSGGNRLAGIVVHLFKETALPCAGAHWQF